MIVCGKCGFTQPRDVYCANCGINLEKYKPEKPSTWVRLAKDPLALITGAIIASVAVFFLVINNPKASIPPSEIQFAEPQSANLDETPSENITNSDKSTKLNIVKKTKKSIKDKISEVQKQFAAKPIPAPPNKIQQDAILEETKAKSEAALDTDNTDGTSDTASNLDPPETIIANFSFYEITPNQLEKYFTGTARVQASTIEATSDGLALTNFNKLPLDRPWNLATAKTMSFDYMLEPEDDGEPQGIKIVANRSEIEGDQQTINLRLTANIPNQNGTNTSIDWSRVFNLTKGSSVIIKVRLPEAELPATFADETYNTPLSIMTNPQYLDQKLQLLIHLKL